MRNLKRVLSLALACVMVIGMMVMGAGAADFSDAAEIDYTEAVDVISALGIIEGIANGDDTYRFNPDGILTREGAAKLICYMMVGEENAKMLTATKTFSDVKATGWSAPYISYCVSLGYIAGNGDGTFNPEGKLTGLAFAKLLLCALGYDAEIEGYVNNKNWATNIAADAFDAGLNIAGVDLNAQLTREQAAQMMLNAIKAPLVEYETKGSNLTINGAELTFGASKAQYVTTTLAKEQRISDQKLSNNGLYTVEFGEKYMPGLWLNEGETDVFGRPAHYWTYRNEDTALYVDMDLLVKEYTEATTYAKASKDIAFNSKKDYTVEAYVDGLQVATTGIVSGLTAASRATVANTGNGVLTQVFVDHARESITFVFINTWLAEATANYNAATKTVPVKVHTGYSTVDPQKLSGTDPVVAGLKMGDFVKVTRATTNGGVSYGIQSVEAVEVVPGVTVDSYTTKTGVDTANTTYYLDTLMAGADKYVTGEKAYYDAALMVNYNDGTDHLDNASYNLFLDNYGYVLGLKKITTFDPYVFVVGYEAGSSFLATAIDKALIITTEGEMKVVDVRDDRLSAGDAITAGPAVNTWYTYVMDGDTYILKAKCANQDVVDATNQTGADICGTYADLTGVGGAVAYGNAKTVYITVDADETVTGHATEDSIVKVNGMTTGIKNANIEVDHAATFATGNNNIFFLHANGYVTYAVVVGADITSTSNMVFFTGGALGKAYDSADKEYYVTYPAIVGGELTTVKVLDACATSADPAANQLFTATFDQNGYIAALTGAGADTEYAATAGLMNSTANKTAGYTLNVNPTGYKLIGATLYVDTATTNDKYVVIGNECDVFVKLAGATGYAKYESAELALAALSADAVVTQITTICDNLVTGYAKTLIITEAKPGVTTTYSNVDELQVKSTVASGALTTGGTTPNFTLAVDIDKMNDVAPTVAQLLSALEIKNGKVAHANDTMKVTLTDWTGNAVAVADGDTVVTGMKVEYKAYTNNNVYTTFTYTITVTDSNP